MITLDGSEVEGMSKVKEIDFDSLCSDVRGGRMRRDFGVGSCLFTSIDTPDGDKFGVDIVMDNPDAKFIHLFGLSVDMNSGDIALGFFPNKDCYIRIGENFFSLLARKMFDMISMPEWVDTKYLLEMLKMNPRELIHSGYSEVIDMYRESKKDFSKYQSVLLTIASQWDNGEDDTPREIQYFTRNNFKGEFVKDVIAYCVNVSVACDRVATNFFGAFLSESSREETAAVLQLFEDEGLRAVHDKTQPNIEALTLIYIGKYKVPPEFLIALKTLGLGLKQRKAIVSLIASRFGEVQFRDMNAVLSVMEQLSSFSYLFVGDSKSLSQEARVFTFNVIDLLHTVGWEGSMLFSLDMVTMFQNRSMYDSIVRRFSVRDMLTQMNITEKDFIRSLDIYRKSVLHLKDNGSLYTRKTLPSQYAMLTFSVKQLESAGEVFESMSKMILKKF